LDHKAVVVTGAANGIGRALSSQLWARGCDLALIDQDAEALASLERELQGARRDQTITTHVADVGDRVRMREACDELAAVHRRVHVLVNSAGVAREAAFAQTSLDDWDRIVGANLWGVIHACHFLMPHLAKVDRAHIVNICSMLGIVAMPGQSGYVTTKFALRGFSEALAEELRVTRVGLTVVYPGAVATSITKRGGGDDPELIEHISQWYARKAMPAEHVAAQIIRAIERGTPRLLIGSETVVGDWLKRLMPLAGNRLMVDAVVRLLGVEYMRERRITRWNETMVGADPQAHREGAAQ
jgi:short-subunit dehydrogenase